MAGVFSQIVAIDKALGLDRAPAYAGVCPLHEQLKHITLAAQPRGAIAEMP
uniref:Uncharacterized protein n=1 Tax=Rheinheimera sp. BAL341 TaxID=1708203 RepID=A0A486XUD9_9GAMM